MNFQHTQFISLLLSCSPQDDHADTPLIIASNQNHTEVARFLVEYGASINYQDKVFDNHILCLICLLFNSSTVWRISSSRCMQPWQH